MTKHHPDLVRGRRDSGDWDALDTLPLVAGTGPGGLFSGINPSCV